MQNVLSLWCDVWRRLKIIDVLIDILKYATFFLGNFRTITLGKLFNLSFTQVPPRKNITECVFFCLPIGPKLLKDLTVIDIIKNGVIKVPVGTFGGMKRGSGHVRLECSF